jgi:hypothetical protein
MENNTTSIVAGAPLSDEWYRQLSDDVAAGLLTDERADALEREYEDAAFAEAALPADPSFWQGYEEWLDDCRRNELAAAE